MTPSWSAFQAMSSLLPGYSPAGPNLTRLSEEWDVSPCFG